MTPLLGHQSQEFRRIMYRHVLSLGRFCVRSMLALWHGAGWRLYKLVPNLADPMSGCTTVWDRHYPSDA